MGCPGNSTTWNGSVDATTHDVTCTLIGCATGTVLCGDYCIATPTVLSGASCTAASAVSHAGQSPTTDPAGGPGVWQTHDTYSQYGSLTICHCLLSACCLLPAWPLPTYFLPLLLLLLPDSLMPPL